MKGKRIVRKLAGPAIAATLMLAVGAVTGVAQYGPPDPATTPGGVAGTPQGQTPQAASALNDCIKKAKQKYRSAKRKVLASAASTQKKKTKLRTAKKKKKIRIKWCRRNFA